MSEVVLAVFAHPDDEVLACGGTLAKHVAAGDEVTVYVLTDGVESRAQPELDAAKRKRRDQFFAACAELGVGEIIGGYRDQQLDGERLLTLARDIEGKLAMLCPTVVYTHHRGDVNRDHAIVAEAVLVATRPQPKCSVRRVYSGEVLSSTEWAFGGSFVPNVYVDVSGEPLARKTAALACYESELRPSPHPRSEGIVHVLARLRGSTVGVAAAEAFELVREIR